MFKFKFKFIIKRPTDAVKYNAWTEVLVLRVHQQWQLMLIVHASQALQEADAKLVNKRIF